MTERLTNPALRPRRRQERRAPASAQAGRLRRADGVEGKPARLHRRVETAPRGAGSRAPLWSTRPRENNARTHHRQRARSAHQDHVGARVPKRRRVTRCLEPHRDQPSRLHRRDPSPPAHPRRALVPSDGRAQVRAHRRQGTECTALHTQYRAVHADRRHHARRHDHGPAARPLRRRHAPGLLHAGRAVHHHQALGGHLGNRNLRRRRRRDRAPFARDAAHCQSPAQAHARLRASAGQDMRSTARRPTSHSGACASTSAAWTKWTGAS